MSDLEDTHLRRMTVDDLDIVLHWRNHPQVRGHMFSTHEIGREEHARWFERSERDLGRFLLIHERRGVPTAYVSFTKDVLSRRAEWGFYVAPGAAKGSGSLMARDALGFAFDSLGLHKVCGEAVASNTASIGFHLALGFAREGVLRDHHFHGGRYHDVVCFGLLDLEWRGGAGARA